LPARQSETGAAAEKSGNVFTITNEGIRSVFVPAPTNETRLIAPFDGFQENFLRNYAEYCRLMTGTAAAK